MMLAETTSLKLFGGSFTLIGRSRAGEGTCWCIPELKWMFDCGALVQGWKPTHIFVTHTHSDHVHMLTHHLFQKEGKKKLPDVFLPAVAAPLVQAHLEAYASMIECDGTSGGDEEKIVSRLSLHPVEPGEEFEFHQGGVQYIFRTVECVHRISCIGYSIFRRKKVLKDEYKHLPSWEIGKLRKAGEPLFTSSEEPFLCYLGDTTAEVFDRNMKLLREQKVIIVECSFIDKDSAKRAEKTKHMHWGALQPFIEAHPQTLFVLIHFSLSNKSLDLRNFFIKNSKHRNIHPMLIEREVDQEWEKSGGTGPAPSCNCFECCPTADD